MIVICYVSEIEAFYFNHQKYEIVFKLIFKLKFRPIWWWRARTAAARSW